MMTLRNSLIVVAASAIVFASASWAGDDEADEDNIAKAIDVTADKLADEIEEHTKNRDWIVVPVCRLLHLYAHFLKNRRIPCHWMPG